MSVGKLKKGLTEFGSSVKDTVVSVSDTVTTVRIHRDYDKDDELIEHYKHDLSKAKLGLSYIASQQKKMALSHWGKLFKLNIRIVEHFIQLLGTDSLSFKGIEDYYHDFDKFQATEEIPMVHPKERQFLIESVHLELVNYMSSLQQGKFKITQDWDIHEKSLKLRITEMNKHISDTLKLIKKRNKKKTNYIKTEHKISKLMKKTAPLETKEQDQLNTLESSLKEEEKEYTKINDKLKSILPHVISFLDEFVENITKIILCKQVETYKEIAQMLDYFCTFHGFLDTSGDPHNKIQSYEDIISKWEEATTPTRLQIESFISIIYDKKPELIDTEIDEKDKTLSAAKMWNKITDKVVEKKHTVKTKDHVNGIFNDYLSVDPLQAFLQNNDPNSNISETYHPSKVVDVDDVYIPKPVTAPVISPKLPPRVNTAHSSKPLPTVAANKVTTPLPPLPPDRFVYNSNFSRSDSLDSIHSDNESIISDSSSHSTTSLVSDILLHNASADVVNKHLKKVYNSSKNDIKYSPIPERFADLDIPPATDDLIFQKTTTVTYKLHEFNKFFDKIIALSDSMQLDRRVLEAKYDFPGIEPGDLSFKTGDKIEIIFDFQSIDTLYSNDQKNWLIGASKFGQDHFRIGFVPSNYF